MNTQPDRAGLCLGTAAVLFWSFGSSLIYLGARQAGIWRFVAIASLSAGILQMISSWRHRGGIKSALLLPWRLWIGPLLCFITYGLAWPWALANSNEDQVGGVNLINYLWPILTFLLGIWWVPGQRLTLRGVLAMLLSLAGLVFANMDQLRRFLSTDENPDLTSVLPYILALVAAVTWAVYSALLARWRTWAKDFLTSPIGFLAIGLNSCVILSVTKRNGATLNSSGLLLTLLYGAGPLAAGYFLWELALSKAKVQSLSLIAAATPVLSTLLLCGFLKKAPAPNLVVSALLISGGIVLSLGDR